MKIGFPALGTDNKLMTFLSKDFVESGLIGVYNDETKEIHITSKEQIGSLLEWVKKEEINTIISPELTPMALRVFKEHGIAVFKAEGSMLSLNLRLLENNSLIPFSLFDLQFQGASSCSSSCSSCNSASCN